MVLPGKLQVGPSDLCLSSATGYFENPIVVRPDGHMLITPPEGSAKWRYDRSDTTTTPTSRQKSRLDARLEVPCSEGSPLSIDGAVPRYNRLA